MKLLLNHCSVRNYLPTRISQDLLDEILYSGIRASNTGNMQLYSIVVTLDEEKKKTLAPCHFNQAMVLQAPVLLTICFDISRFYKWCDASNTTADFKNLLWLLNGTIDVSILSQNICIAAENKGLGICYLGTTLYNAPEISNVLHLPVGVVPITALTIGYPATSPEKTDRLSLDAVVHYEEYKDYNE
jgi:nitroreductase